MVIGVAALATTAALSGRPAGGCSAFVVTDGRSVLFGSNEDFWNPATRVWFVPAAAGELGRVYFGYDDLVPQGGMNERGLVYDGLATQPTPVTGSKDKPEFAGNLIDHAMATCTTVAEVVALFDRYNLWWMQGYNLIFADAGGSAAVLEGDHVVRKNGSFQVATNFNLSEHPDGVGAYGVGTSCARFDIARTMLAEMKQPTVDGVRSVLAAIHAEGPSRTLYSTIYDLKRRTIRVYNYHDFVNEVTLDLVVELAKGRRFVVLASLFPRNFAHETFAKEQRDALDKRRTEHPAVAVPETALALYAGTYQGPDGALAVALEAGALVVDYAAYERAALVPTSETTFLLLRLGYDLEVAFQRNTTGEITAVTIGAGGESTTFPRIR
jgi:hypothetical protein